MIVELHVLQNFAPANLNRDDTGSPKDCEFGGFRRARISSQAIKRAIRREFSEGGLIEPATMASRTKRITEAIVERLITRGREEESSQAVAKNLIESAGLRVGDDGLTQYLVFFGSKEMDHLSDLCDQHWDALIEGSDVSRDIKNAIIGSLDGGKAADLALFGRMIADLPGKNLDAASQVAHAISTNRLSMEFDYYTALDDLKPDDTAGADMIGTIGFNSACFYRYSNVDTSQLLGNLQGDGELSEGTLEAFLRASVAAIPKGKQNSMAAHNPPSLVFAVVRETGHSNLANAFVNPIRPSQEADLVQNSVSALDTYWGQLLAMYGQNGIIATAAVSLDGNGLNNLAQTKLVSCEELYACVKSAASATN